VLFKIQNSGFLRYIIKSNQKKMAQQEINHIVRIFNTDMDGNKEVFIALKKIKGLSFTFNTAICRIANIDKKKKAGYLTEEEIKKITDILKDPASFDIPTWMFNKRKDYETGEDKHFVAVDLDLAKEEDFKRLMKVKSYKGLRHAWHLPVRGQRTRSNFRPNKGKVVGVKKKAGAKGGRV
jgi:small subunit ribosomal protein S13